MFSKANQVINRDRNISFSFFLTRTSFLKDWNLVPCLVLDVFVNGEDEHEHEEESSPAKEVPNVMPDINTAGKLST